MFNVLTCKTSSVIKVLFSSNDLNDIWRALLTILYEEQWTRKIAFLKISVKTCHISFINSEEM